MASYTLQFLSKFLFSFPSFPCLWNISLLVCGNQKIFEKHNLTCKIRAYVLLCLHSIKIYDLKHVTNFYPFVHESFPCDVTKVKLPQMLSNVTWQIHLKIFLNHSFHWQLYFRWRTHISPQISCQIWPPYTFVLRWGTASFPHLKDFPRNSFFFWQFHSQINLERVPKNSFSSAKPGVLFFWICVLSTSLET